MASNDRAELMRNAVAFLTDPQSQSSSLTQRIQFLEAKGLASNEIQEAMTQAALQRVPAYQSMAGPSYQPAYESSFSAITQPQRGPLDWRDYFIMTIVSGSLFYGAATLARKYLMPYLKPPNSTVYEDDKDALTAQFDAAEALLKEIQAETAAMRVAVVDQQQKVDEVTADVKAAVKEMRDGETRNRDEMREIREEINSIREMLPKMMEKNKESQNQSLGELQQELKSLKALLLSRGPGFSTSPSPGLPSFVGRPSIPSWQLAAHATSNTPINPSEANGHAVGVVTPNSSPVSTHPDLSQAGPLADTQTA